MVRDRGWGQGPRAMGTLRPTGIIPDTCPALLSDSELSQNLDGLLEDLSNLKSQGEAREKPEVGRDQEGPTNLSVTAVPI